MNVSGKFESTLVGRNYSYGTMTFKLLDELKPNISQCTDVSVDFQGEYRPPFPVSAIPVSIELDGQNKINVKPRFDFFNPMTWLLSMTGFNMNVQRTDNIYTGTYTVNFPRKDAGSLEFQTL